VTVGSRVTWCGMVGLVGGDGGTLPVCGAVTSELQLENVPHSWLATVVVCRLGTPLSVECCLGLAPSELHPGQLRLL
jgi:hypothetical protein